MKYISLENRKKQRENTQKFMKKLFEDIKSDKPYSEKKYLQQFDNTDKNNSNVKCNYCNVNGQQFFTNHYGSNNVNISGIIHSNYYGHCTPSLF